MNRKLKEEFLNEGASAVLDLSNTAFCIKAWLAAKAAFSRLTGEQQLALLAETYRRAGTFDPQSGQFVCYCCGLPFWASHGRNLLM